MPFEYDSDKSESNLEKHGIDFEQAQELWNDVKAIEKKLPYEDEERFIRIGSIGSKIWAAVFTFRDGSVRLISVRRARDNEEQQYKDTSIDG